MALPTSITISLNILQIVYLEDKLQLACRETPIRNTSFLNDPSWKDFPLWLKKYNETSSTYSRSFCHALNTDKDAIETALRKQIPWMSKHCKCLKEFYGSVFFEPHLCQWIISYQLDIETDLLDKPEKFPDIEPRDYRTDKDLYNQLRDFFVRSDGIDKKSPLVFELERQGKYLIIEALKRAYGYSSVDENEISVPDSAGNITLFILDTAPAEEPTQTVDFVKYFVSLHECAERIGSTAQNIEVPELRKYVFWGRFHTVIADNENALERIMPIHFQAQLLWAYLTAIEGCIQNVESQILSNNISKASGIESSITSLINSIQYAHFMNERFRRSLEKDATRIYAKIENRWHIDSSLNQNKEFAEYLASYINRSMQEQSLRSESRQNRVLSIIAVLGFLALIDTWSSFLEMSNESYDMALENPFISMLFSSSSLMAFNFGFSLIITILCITLIIYFLTRK